MRRFSRAIIFSIAFLVVFSLVWSKLHIRAYIHITFWQAIFVFGFAVLALFLIIDHLLNRKRE